MKTKSFLLVAAATILASGGNPLFAHANEIRTERIQFAKGASATSIEDRIEGRAIVDYQLGARAGQRMNVSLTSENLANYFNIMAPDESEVAFFIGSRDGNRFEGVLPATGDYTIRVYLMRNAARRGETANYRLDVAIVDEKAIPSERKRLDPTDSSVDALVPGTDFHATGEIPCRRRSGQPMTSCRFGVRREGNGSALVTVFWPGGGSRAIFFEGGRVIGSDWSEADGEGSLSADRESDLTRVRIGTERFEIPDAVLDGG